MRGTGYALLDRLGRITDGVAVLRPQGSSAALPDIPSYFYLSYRHRRWWFSYQNVK